MSEILWCADNGDGTYRNPVLYCDYSDPDAICVNGTYYLTASTFNYVPGLPILTSRDLVNWKLRNYAVKNIPEARYAAPQHAQGIWAPAIRFQNGHLLRDAGRGHLHGQHGKSAGGLGHPGAGKAGQGAD